VKENNGKSVFIIDNSHQTSIICDIIAHNIRVISEKCGKYNCKNLRHSQKVNKELCLPKINEHQIKNLFKSCFKITLKWKKSIKNNHDASKNSFIIIKARITVPKGPSEVTQAKSGDILENRRKSLKYREVYDFNAIKILLSNDVELNPGPNNNFKDLVCDKSNLFVCSYNLQGCGNFKKIKRVMNNLNTLPFRNSSVINLQETHWNNLTSINYHWKSGIVQSGNSTTRGGVAILYSDSYFDNIIETYKDDDGRMCTLLAQKDEEMYLFINIYAPNDHHESYVFFQRVGGYLDEMVLKYPSVNLFLAGDFNLIFDPSVDAVGRNQSKQEKKVVRYIENISIKNNLVDTYRILNKYGGFTWGRNNPTYLRSRLDHVLMSKSLVNQLLTSNTSFVFQESDHGFLFSEIMVNKMDFGPGIIRANAELLDDQTTLDKVNRILEEDYIMSNNRGWDPHLILDHHKYVLRQTLLNEGRLKRIKEKSIYERSCYEIDSLKHALNLELEKITIPDSFVDLDRVNSLKQAIELAEIPINELKEIETKRLIFRSKAKWSEEGEKSTKYFLNLLKTRQKKCKLGK